MNYYFDILPEDIMTKIFIKLKGENNIRCINEKAYQRFLDKLYDGKINPFEVFEHKFVTVEDIKKDIIKFMDSITIEDDHWRYGGHCLIVNKKVTYFEDIEQMKKDIVGYLTGDMLVFLDEHVNKYGTYYDEDYDIDNIDGGEKDYDYYQRYILLYNERKEFIFILKEIDLTEPSRIFFHVEKEYHILWNLIFTHKDRDILLRANGFDKYITIHPYEK